MATLYLDIFSGISGDMFIGALIDLGVDARQLERELRKLPVSGYHLHVARKSKSSIVGTKFDVHLESDCNGSHSHDHPHDHDHGHSHATPVAPAAPASISFKAKPASQPAASNAGHGHGHDHAHDHNHHGDRTFSDIRALITSSRLSEWVQAKAIAIFERIAQAEGKIHGVPPAKVHFHEVGAVDSIVDIVGACIGLELLDKPRVLASAVVEGTGWVRCAHGRFPVPTAATLEILGARGIGLTQCEEPHELVTPTGAAILAEFAEAFGPMNQLVATRVGYGLGTRDNKTRPNVLRAVLCTESPTTATPVTHDWSVDRIAVLETNLDDINSEVLGHVLEKAMRLGALDAFHTPIFMKKNRPGVLLTILCPESDSDTFAELLLTETSAFGIRQHSCERRKLQREIVPVPTEAGQVAIKIGRLDGRIVQLAPEFESCRSVAVQSGLPVKTVYELAIAAAQSLRRGGV